MEILAVLIVLAVVYGVSFLFTSGIIYLICWCFDFVFSWPLAFGCWLILILLRSIFNVTVKKD